MTSLTRPVPFEEWVKYYAETLAGLKAFPGPWEYDADRGIRHLAAADRRGRPACPLGVATGHPGRFGSNEVTLMGRVLGLDRRQAQWFALAADTRHRCPVDLSHMREHRVTLRLRALILKACKLKESQCPLID